jgi:hypothetical protein
MISAAVRFPGLYSRFACSRNFFFVLHRFLFYLQEETGRREVNVSTRIAANVLFSGMAFLPLRLLLSEPDLANRAAYNIGKAKSAAIWVRRRIACRNLD